MIPLTGTSVPPDINSLLDATNHGLEAIPHDNLRTVIDESYTAVGGLGPELSRLVKGSTDLAIDARKPGLADHPDRPVATGAGLPDRHGGLHPSVGGAPGHGHRAAARPRHRGRGLLDNGGPAADEARQLFDRLQPTLPLLLANLVSVANVAVTYQPDIEQLLVLLPQAVAIEQAGACRNSNTKQAYKGLFLDFNLNLNLPPTCTTGFLPPQQQRAARRGLPARPAGDLYCRMPQDSTFNVRGATQHPCLTVPGKRAPREMCESDEHYVPLNDGYNWKGDPNATLSGQDVPNCRPSAPVAVRRGSPAPPRRAGTPLRWPSPNTTPPPALTSDPTGTCTPNPTYPKSRRRSKHGKTCSFRRHHDEGCAER